MTEPRLDSLGRRNNGWAKAGPGRPRNPEPSEPNEATSIWFCADKDMRIRLRAQSKTKGVTMSELIRTYCEWGLENDS